MVIAIFGESCTGKSTIADYIKERLGAATDIYSGKDYLRLAKNEADAARAFEALLQEKSGSNDNVIFVTGDITHLAMLPENCVRVLTTADIELIKKRFSERTGGTLPPPVAQMLERKHGQFDNEKHDIRIVSGVTESVDACAEVLKFIGM